MKEIGKEELKIIQLDILKSVHDFCEQRGLRYSLTYGTLLGAVRHKGFIPWDDDIDIMMPRPDYEIFQRTYAGFNSDYSVQSYYNDASYWFSFIKVYDKRTLFVEAAARNGVYVDIFPIDGMPEEQEDINKIRNEVSLLVNHDLRWATKEYRVRTKKKDRILNYLKYQCRRFMVGSRLDTIKKIDEMFLGNAFESSPMAGIFFFDRMTAVLPRTLYEHYKPIQFEGHMFNSIGDTHLFLKCVYGDYMQLPPEEQRVGRHNIHAYWL